MMLPTFDVMPPAAGPWMAIGWGALAVVAVLGLGVLALALGVARELRGPEAGHGRAVPTRRPVPAGVAA